MSKINSAFCVAGMEVTSNVSASDSDEVASPVFHQLFTSPVRAANTATTNFSGNDYFWSRPAFRAPDTQESSAAARRKGKSRKRPKRRKDELPAVRKDSSGEIYLPTSDISHPLPSNRRRQDPGGRSALPPVSRNSAGDVYLPIADRNWRQHRLHDPADSETTPSSVILQQIDHIYGKYDRAPSSCQYFSNCRPPPRLDYVVEDERDHPMNEEDSVMLYFRRSYITTRLCLFSVSSFFPSSISVFFFFSSTFSCCTSCSCSSSCSSCSCSSSSFCSSCSSSSSCCCSSSCSCSSCSSSCFLSVFFVLNS